MMPNVKPSFKIAQRKQDTHKGDYGHVLIIAGSAAMTGAGYLCTESAMLSGAGLVTLAIPKSLNLLMHKKLIEAMTLPLPDAKEGYLGLSALNKITDFAKKCSCVLIGPGLSQNPQTKNLIRSLIKNLDMPSVIDADGLNALKGRLDILQKVKCPERNIIITPHPGEMARLTGLSASYINKHKKDVAKKFSIEYNVTVVLKGMNTVVSSPKGECFVNTTGNPGMASGGCGDVLSGIIAALFASGMESFKSACLGVYIHGLAGDMASKEIGEISLRARDLLTYLPKAFKKLYK